MHFGTNKILSRLVGRRGRRPEKRQKLVPGKFLGRAIKFLIGS